MIQLERERYEQKNKVEINRRQVDKQKEFFEGSHDH